MKKIFKKKRILLSILLLLLCFLPNNYKVVNAASSSSVIYYTSACINGYSGISADNDVLYAAKKSKNVTTQKGTFNYAATISTSSEVHIYHFKASSEGYWNFYTTGKTDTVIKVYEDNSFLWSKNFKSVGINDDPDSSEGDYIDYYYYHNASLKVKLTSGEDYYICVRAYGSNVGTYKLFVEPNQDKLNPLYNVKKNNRWDLENLSNGSSYTGCYTRYCEYLTKDETLFLYWAISGTPVTYYDDYGIEQQFTFSDWHNLVSKGTPGWVSIAYSVVGVLLGIAAFIVDPTKVVATTVISSISLTTSGLSFVDTLINAQSNLEKKSLLSSLTNSSSCYVRYNMSVGHWLVGKAIKISYNAMKYTYSINGTSCPITSFYYSYSSYNNNDMMVGDIYEKGKWSSK